MIAICVYQYIIHFSSDQTEWYCQNQQTDYDAEDYHGEHDVKHIMRSNTLWGQIHCDATVIDQNYIAIVTDKNTIWLQFWMSGDTFSLVSPSLTHCYIVKPVLRGYLWDKGKVAL